MKNTNYVKSITLDLTSQDYISLTSALSTTRAFYQKQYEMFVHLDNQYASLCDMRISSLDRLSRIVEVSDWLPYEGD